jgi:hypothetical protein
VSTLWTPGGERPVGGQAPTAPAAEAGRPATEGAEQLSEEELQAKMEELRQQLADAPAELVVANHCFGLFELAALHLSLQPPRLPQARLAIDALSILLDGLAGRLGSEEQQLREGLSSLRLAYVQIERSQGEGAGAAPSGDAAAGADPDATAT